MANENLTRNELGPQALRTAPNAVSPAPLPGATGDYSTFDGGDDFAIPAAAKNPSGAWEFITWVMNEQQQEQYPDLGATPIRTDLLTPAFSAAHPLDAVPLKALGHPGPSSSAPLRS